MLSQRPTHDGSGDLDALLSQCAGGNAVSLRRIYDLQAPRMYAIALRLLRDRATADDVLQETFLQVWRNAGRFDPARGSGEAWMISLLRYRALDVLRHRQREQPSDAPDLGDAPQDPVAIETITSGQESRALKRCLGQLDEKNRRCILLAYLDGFTHHEIADHLSLPLGTVKAWIRRGLLLLRGCLADVAP